MFQILEQHKKAARRFDASLLRIKAVRMRGEYEPKEIPIDFKVGVDWETISQIHGEGNMRWRQSYKRHDEYAVSCHWDAGSMLYNHKHPRADEYIYVIRGSLRNLNTGEVIEAGEKNSLESVLAGTASAQPYVIPAGTPHFIQALEDDTWFVVKFIPHGKSNR
jgi:quercetin dioxygenase-like cupin family protein